MKPGDLVRTKDYLNTLVVGDVILLLENHGVKRYYNMRPGLLFSGLCIRTQKAGYFVFEHDAEVINESR